MVVVHIEACKTKGNKKYKQTTIKISFKHDLMVQYLNVNAIEREKLICRMPGFLSTYYCC